MRTGTLTVEDQKPACFIVHEELIYNSDADYVHNNTRGSAPGGHYKLKL